MRSPKVKFLTIFTFCIFITKMSFASNSCSNEAGTMFRIEPNLIKAIALVESNLKKDSIGKNRDKNNNIKSLDYWLMQINQMHIPLLKKRGIIKDERDLLDNPCLNIKIGTLAHISAPYFFPIIAAAIIPVIIYYDPIYRILL